jgi:hypothetical protein
MSVSDEDLWARLDSDGIAKVRANLATNVYLGHDKARVLVWLERCNEDSNTEQIAIARSAKEAAWASASAADKANSKATIALILAAISIVATFVGIFVSIIGLRR